MANVVTSTTSTPTPTSYIALTSIFTPPPSCSSSWSYEPSDFNANPSGLFIQNAVGGDSYDTACWPPGFTHNGRAEVLGTVQVFSPGYCPQGYSTALMAPGDTTTVTCCLSGFTYRVSSATGGERAGGALAGCISTFSSDETTTVLARPLGTLEPNNLIVTSTLDGASLGQVTMWAQPLTIAYQQRDLTLFSTSSSAASSSAAASTMASSANAASSGASSASATSSPSESSGLSTGAKAGIGIGAALGGLALISLLVFFLLRRRKRQQQEAPHVAAYEAQPQYPPQEMDGESPRVEMSHAADPMTKVRPGRVHEVEGSTGHYA